MKKLSTARVTISPERMRLLSPMTAMASVCRQHLAEEKKKGKTLPTRNQQLRSLLRLPLLDTELAEQIVQLNKKLRSKQQEKYRFSHVELLMLKLAVSLRESTVYGEALRGLLQEHVLRTRRVLKKRLGEEGYTRLYKRWQRFARWLGRQTRGEHVRLTDVRQVVRQDVQQVVRQEEPAPKSLLAVLDEMLAERAEVLPPRVEILRVFQLIRRELGGEKEALKLPNLKDVLQEKLSKKKVQGKFVWKLKYADMATRMSALHRRARRVFLRDDVDEEVPQAVGNRAEERIQPQSVPPPKASDSGLSVLAGAFAAILGRFGYDDASKIAGSVQRRFRSGNTQQYRMDLGTDDFVEALERAPVRLAEEELFLADINTAVEKITIASVSTGRSREEVERALQEVLEWMRAE